ncbi:MAG: hypothetical protein O2967_20030 [Proteobacteria bacterium]|nr:hypothetical protein [Pseudomonadota bacterium]
MKYVCDGPGGTTWFRIETEVEAGQESSLMQHAVEKHFRREMAKAAAAYKPTSTVFIEQNIGLAAHLQRAMPLFLTLRDGAGHGLATAMLPPGGGADKNFKIVIVGPENSDPYPDHVDGIKALGRHFGLTLEREHCFPYAR